MRKFLIQNEYGEKIELQGGSIFLHSPSGLGFQDNIEYMEADGFYIETYREPAQVEKSGTIVFKPTEAYKSYFEFMNWIFAAEKLTLGYNPCGTWYYTDIDITSLDKGELGVGGTLEIPVVFMPTSPIYAPLNLNLTINGDNPQDIKMYTYRYPYRYSASAKSGVLDFTIDAQIASDFSVSIAGPVSAPILTAKRMDTGNTIGRIDLSAVSTTEGETLVFDTRPKRSGARLETTDGSTDLTGYIGINSDAPTFFQFPANVPLELELSATSLIGVTANIRVYRYYRTV